MSGRLSIALCVFAASAFAQDTGPTAPDPAYAPCLEGQTGTRVYESSVLTSPDGLWRARATVDVQPGGPLGCSNTSTLLVQGPDEDYRPAYVQKPTSDVLGNGLKLIAWSSQKHLLAVEISWWQYASDFDGVAPLVYDADRKRAVQPDLAKLFALKFHKKECAFNTGEVLGFDSQNRLLFEADDWYGYAPDGDEPDPQTRCLGGPGVWAFDLDKNQVEFVKSSEHE